jgi:hypothetical protein
MIKVVTVGDFSCNRTALSFYKGRCLRRNHVLNELYSKLVFNEYINYGEIFECRERERERERERQDAKEILSIRDFG